MPLPGPGQDLEWEGQTWQENTWAPSRMEVRAAWSPTFRCRSPFICLLSRHAFLGLFKGSGTFFPMHLSGNGWQVGSVGAGSECLPLRFLSLPQGSLGTFVI